MFSVLLKRVYWFTYMGLSWSVLASGQELYDGRTIQSNSAPKITVEEFTAKIPKGSIVVIGEQHNFLPIQQGQVAILKSLRKMGHQINVGMEFLKYPDQEYVDAYRAGKLSMADFKKLSWGDADLTFYNDQILFPNSKDGEKTFAINSPTAIPLAVKTKGLANLTTEEKALLPPNFQVGGPSYKERFIERMSGHVGSEEAMNKYFEAQSVWDDTMAWKICEAAKNSDKTLVVIVGQFHVEYEDGLIARIHSRCAPTKPLTSVYQYLFFKDEEIDLTPLFPSEKYGPLSDYLMIVQDTNK